jgi:thiamine pyrophosphate-dependent acetolactate synthase large subunit-like protein
MQNVLTDDTTVTVDVGSHYIWLARKFRSYENKKPPSPATETTCVFGRTSAAEIAHGNATPNV